MAGAQGLVWIPPAVVRGPSGPRRCLDVFLTQTQGSVSPAPESPRAPACAMATGEPKSPLDRRKIPAICFLCVNKF